MDMYQKREMRKNKKMDENEKSLPSTSIKCLKLFSIMKGCKAL